MRITSRTPQELVVQDSSMWVSYLCGAAGVMIVFFSISQNKLKGLFSAAFFLLFALLFGRRTTFTFDAMQRIARWKGRKFFKTESGEIPFDDITDIGTEATLSGDNSTSYRLTILTRDGSIPMAYTYTASPDAYASLRQDVLDFIKPGSYTPVSQPGILSSGIPADLEPSIRSLLSQGRKIDAVALLRSTQHIGLADAKERVEQIEETMRTTS
jgi:hypothetical protein